MNQHQEENALLDKPDFAKYSETCWQKIKRNFGYGLWEEERIIYLNGITYPQSFHKNIVVNTKYNLFTFLPLVLYAQFKYFLNAFTLVLALTQLFQILRVGFVITYIGPLLFILAISISKEAYDDLTRYCRDREINTTMYKVLQPDGTFQNVQSANLKVGNIIEIQLGQRIPADLILLYTTEKSGSVFIKTDQLDGETDWKLRKAIRMTQSFQVNNNNQSLMNCNCRIEVEKPNKNIYNFTGRIISVDTGQTEPIGLENTMWANTIITIGTSLCQIIYTGKETRSQMNTRAPRTKIGILDNEVNFMIFIVFLLMFCLSLIMVVLNRFHQWYIMIIRFIVLLSCIIPISLRVNFDIAKLYYCYIISNDEKIKGTIARNSTIPEELGRIEYLFSDKTGTLTQNVMEFKKLCVNNVIMEKKEIIEKQQELLLEGRYRTPFHDIEIELNAGESENKSSFKTIKRKQNDVLLDTMTCLALCHSVTPSYNGNEKEYQASSPDEIALVKFSDEFGIILKERSQTELLIIVDKKEYKFEILAEFPFTSATKRMGIILKDLTNGRIIFLLKGAEVELRKKVKNDVQYIVDDNCNELAKSGLRTLVFCEKMLKNDEFEEWNREYNQARESMQERDAKTRLVIEKLESNMELLGISGVEDKLQEDVSKVMNNLKEAGIKIWMLTGDKAETAKCISISSGLKKNNETFEEILDLPDNKFSIENHLKTIKSKSTSNAILLIDGNTFANSLIHCEALFFEIAATCKGVVVCRCSPTQKTIVVNKMKLYTRKRCAAIGDGGNDVGMIQESHCGIGIQGKEGLQASLSADFSISNFKSVQRLVLYHGALSYKRSSSLTHFIIHRGTIITIIQFIFNVVFYYSPITIYNSYLILGYATIYTFWPVLCFLFNKHVSSKKAIQYPQCYEEFTKGNELGSKNFVKWTLFSVYQGSIIMYGTLLFIENSFVKLVTISFSALILTEFANIWADLNKCYKKTFVFLFFSFLMYLGSMVWMKSTFDLNIFNTYVALITLLIFIVAFIPPYIIKKIIRWIWPQTFDIVGEFVGNPNRSDYNQIGIHVNNSRVSSEYSSH